jgi:arabinofuranosyltransferase
MVEAVGAATWPARVKTRVVTWDRVTWLTLTVVSLFLLLAEHDARRLGRNVPDDAITSMQYARNLVHGHGLVFNVGERVDGYTNFLWVLVMAPLYAFCEALGVAFVPFMTHVGAWLGAACVGLAALLARDVLGRALPVLVAVLFCALDNAFSTWAVLGLETHLVALLMLVALLATRSTRRDRGPLVGLALLGLHLTRPDAALFGFAWVASELLEVAMAWRAHEPRARRRLRDLGLALAVWLPLYGAYFAWHYGYYGAPFPNTY